MGWTKEQEKAIYTRGQNIIVSAGAGSGKTAVLSERILDYCINGGDIRKILVLTFTNKAALEMKERIRSKLIKNKLFEQVEYIDSAYITTFDAYSLALVKKYYYKLNLSKNLTIMDSALIELKKKEILDSIFQELYSNNDIIFLNFLKKYAKQDDKEVKDIILKISASLDLIINIEKFRQEYESNYLSDKKLSLFVDEYEILTREKINEFISVLSDLLSYASCDDASKKLYESVEEILLNLKSLSTYEEYYQYINNCNLQRVNPKASFDVKESKKVANDLLASLKSDYFSKYMFKSDMFDELSSCKEDIIFLLDISHLLLNKLLEYKKSVMSFDYSDIAKYAISLVTDHVDVKNELKYYYNEILVDEYQDTSDIQEAFLSAIENNNLYMVGDIKQSIYRFRNANPYIFKEKYDRYSKNDGGIKIDLTYNFRSRSEVLDDINLLFNKLMTNSCGDADYMLSHQMKYGLKAYEGYTESNFKLEGLVYNKDDLDYTKEEIEAFVIAREIKKKIDSKVKVFKNGSFNDITFGDFAILIDKASSFVTFKKIFEYCNVPISIEADLDLKDSILPKLFSNILLVITKFKNNDFDVKYRHGLASIARSFIYQYSDEDIYRLLNLDTHYNILDDIEYLAGLKEIDYSSLFFEITSKMNIYNKISYIGDVSNSLVVIEYIHSMFNMFTDISYSYEQASEYLSNVFSSDVKLPYKVESSSSDCVKIMTIHKSKGLEFPYCYFPLLSSGFNKSDIRASIGFHSDYGIYMPFYDNGKSNTIIKALITDKLNKENISEKVRLLYVALTRAREKMIIVLEEKEEKNINEFIYNSFRDMLDHINVFEDRYRLIDLNDYNLSYQYKMKNNSSNSVSGNEIISYDERTLPKEVIKGRISKEMHELPTKKVKNNINLGLEFHSALEALDFKKLDIDSLPANDFIKITLKKVFKHPIFERIKEAKTYHEHEFYEVFDDVEYHGIIDLLVIYDDHIDIIDYKLSNVDSSEYVRQLALYKKYVKTKWNKEINVYLLSLINAEIKRLDV